jgi:hypothetical protein
MSQNPFAHPMEADGAPQGPPRTSGLAVGAFASSLICWVPLIGLIPTVLGVSALISISRSQRRLTGRGFAVTGIVLGMSGTMVWCGIGIGLARVLAGLKPYQSAFSAIESGDVVGARRDMTTQLASSLTDEQLSAFRVSYHDKLGEPHGFRQGLKDVVIGWLSFAPAMGRIMHNAQTYGQQNLIPLPAEFDRGPGIVLFVMDPQAPLGVSGIPRICNIGVAGEDGKIVWLIDPAAGP